MEVFCDSQAAIRQAAHLEPGPRQRLARRINRRARSLLAHGIATEIHWVPGHSSIRGNEEADRQANLARDASGSTVIERPYTWASNRARRISDGRSAAKAEWEADKCSKHFSYRLKGKAGTKRPIPMTSVQSLAAGFYRLKSGHAPTGVYLKQFGHRDDDKCWWCGGNVSQTREHHQQKTFPSGRNGSVRVDALRQSRQRHPGGGLLRARHQCNASRCISPSDRRFAVSSRSVGLLF